MWLSLRSAGTPRLVAAVILACAVFGSLAPFMRWYIRQLRKTSR
jgi:hypothetical protein